MKNIVRMIKLYVTDRERYNEHKEYSKLQKDVRRKLKKAAKEFCPWSGFYIHEVNTIMINFYRAVYSKGLCCWTESARTGALNESLETAVAAADMLSFIDEAEMPDVIAIAKKDGVAFYKHAKAFASEFSFDLENEFNLYAAAYDYLCTKFTKQFYNTIGEHIWDWCD